MSRRGNPLVREVMEAAGLSSDGARRRLFQYGRGHIDCDRLFAPRNANLFLRTPDPAVLEIVLEIMAKAGLSRAGAENRLHAVRRGKLPPECLTLTTEELRNHRAATSGNGEGRRGVRVGAWGDLGLGPRRSVASIPGGTAWERRHLGT